jgi:hypothetical protein
VGSQLGAVWERYEVGETLTQHQRVARAEGLQRPSQMAVWIDSLTPYYGDHPDGLGVAREYVSRHGRVDHASLPPLIDGWEREGALFWVHRSAAGPSIPEFLQEHKPTLAALEPLMVSLAEALITLHEAGLFHGSLDTKSVVVAGKRLCFLMNRGIRFHLNHMYNQSSVEEGFNAELKGGPELDIAVWGEALGACLTGEPEFGRVKLSARSAGTFEIREAEETLRRHGVVGELPGVVLRAARAKTDPAQGFRSMEEGLRDFLSAVALDRVEEGRRR